MNFLRRRTRDLSDEVLMERAQGGSQEACETLYARYDTRLVNYFYRMLGGDAEKAQDFLHDLFVKVVERPESFDTRKSFSTWIFSVAHNMCKNEYRRLEVRNRPETVAEIEARSHERRTASPDRDLEDRAFRKALTEALQTFDDAHRTTFLLRYQEDLPIREISAVLGCAEGTTKSRLYYTTRRLADMLDPLNPFVEEVPAYAPEANES